MSKTISVSFEITDKGTFRKVTADAEELGRAVRSVQDEAQNARRTIVKWAEVSQAFDVLHNTISELQGVISDLTSAYQVQLVAETQLNTIMRQRMNATDQEIQSVKDLCSAQQELGVIGDEVQLSGAQQMATFLQNKQSLDVLIPAMNNLIAQQNGLNATNQDAVSIGNMMGKAMQGQVEVLQRVGITFTDAQKQVLQFGTESERAAMLAQVITDNVGNMNAELAKTDAGKWKQTDNWLGDIKEQLGGMVQRLAPAITMLSQMTMAASGIGKLASSFYTAFTAVKTLVDSMNVAKNVHASMIAVSRLLTASYNGQTVGATTAAVATRALSMAIKGLLISTGVGVAIVALTEIINHLTSSSDEAADSATNMANAEQAAADSIKSAYESTLKSTYSSLMMKYEELKSGWQALRTEHEKTKWIANNKNAFHELGLKINDIASAEDIFNKNTQKVTESFEKRAKAAAYAAELVELYKQQLELKNRKENVDEAIEFVTNKYKNQKGAYAKEKTQRLANLTAQVADKNRGGDGNIEKLNNDLTATNNKIEETKDALKSLGPIEPVSAGGGNGSNNTRTVHTPSPKTDKTDNTPKTHIEELQDQLKKAQEELGNATTIDAKIKADAKVQDIQSEIDEATKGKVTIGAQVDSSYIVQGSDTDKRQSRNNAQQRIDRIKQDYDIGIIADKSDAQRQIDDLNKQLTELGLKPIEVHWETHTEELQRQLQDAQKEFENATTIEAKLKASAKVADLQAQIDTETNGRLTIAAEVEPSYIEQGSLADKRQSYSNAQTKASRIQQDFEIGIIGEDKAKKQIEDLNKQLAKLGKSVKPIKLDINSKDIARIQSLFNIDVTNFDSVRGAMQNIRDITDPTAKGFAAAGASCAMLGSAMQQLGADSAAGKAGMVMAAIGQIVLSFAQALRTCKTWVEWLAFGISGTAQMVSLIATVSKFATGGIVGGNQKSGDNVLVRVNSGEMILNAAQQARLFALADGTATYGAASQVATNFAQGAALPSVSVQTDRLQGIMAGDSGKQPKAVEWRLRGRDIVAAVANETRLNRKRSNIRLK